MSELIAKNEGMIDPEVEKAWLAKAQRRYRELKDGVVEAIPAQEVFKSARDRL